MSQSIAIIDCGSGNLRSAEKAFAHMAETRPVMVTKTPQDVLEAGHIVLPGVGAFGDCADGLRAIDGMVDALNERVLHQGQPFLGICVGMQLMCQQGHERGDYDGLGWMDAHVRALAAKAPLKVPHMGWNDLTCAQDHPVLAGLEGADMYFVHGFAAEVATVQTRDIAATTDYGEPIIAAMARDNIFGTQFHPEKSQAAGLRLIGNFLAWRP